MDASAWTSVRLAPSPNPLGLSELTRGFTTLQGIQNMGLLGDAMVFSVPLHSIYSVTKYINIYFYKGSHTNIHTKQEKQTIKCSMSIQTTSGCQRVYEKKVSGF